MESLAQKKEPIAWLRTPNLYSKFPLNGINIGE